MSFIGNALNGTTNAQAGGFQAQGLSSDSLNAANAQNTNAIAQQQSFLNALQAQNGIGNQSSVFNQLQGVANGTGPNPAQAQLAQATGANTANQAALMAGQRGAGANVGLIARQAAQQGGANQQNAAGQAATMQANQSLNALNNLGGLATQQVSQQQNAVGTLGSETNAALNSNISSMSSQNAANAGIAGINDQNNAKITGGLLGGLGAGGAAAMKAEGGVVDPVPAPAAAPQMAPQAAPSPQNTSGPRSSVGKFLSGALNGDSGQQNQPNQQSQDGYQQGFSALGTAIGNLFSNKSSPSASNTGLDPTSMDAGRIQYATDAGMSKGVNPALAGADSTEAAQAPSAAGPMVAVAAKGGKVPALVSPGERYLSPKAVKEVAEGKKSPMKAGEKIPGEAKVKGAKDSYDNDTVAKTLEAGGIVLPRHVTQAKDPAKEAAKFVNAILARTRK
jgi:hypothetical protein